MLSLDDRVWELRLGLGGLGGLGGLVLGGLGSLGGLGGLGGSGGLGLGVQGLVGVDLVVKGPGVQIGWSWMGFGPVCGSFGWVSPCFDQNPKPISTGAKNMMF